MSVPITGTQQRTWHDHLIAKLVKAGIDETKLRAVLDAARREPITHAPRINKKEIRALLKRELLKHGRLHDTFSSGTECAVSTGGECKAGDPVVRKHGKFCAGIHHALEFAGYALVRSGFLNSKFAPAEHRSSAAAVAFLKNVGIRYIDIALLIAVRSNGGHFPVAVKLLESRAHALTEAVSHERQAERS